VEAFSLSAKKREIVRAESPSAIRGVLAVRRKGEPPTSFRLLGWGMMLTRGMGTFMVKAEAVEPQARPKRHIRLNKDFLMLFVGINLYERVRSIPLIYRRGMLRMGCR